MTEQDDDPRMKELLRIIGQVDTPSYPDYARGLRWGLWAGLTVALITAALMTVSRLTASGEGAGIGIGGILLVTFSLFLTVFLLAWAFGAFRPQK